MKPNQVSLELAQALYSTGWSLQKICDRIQTTPSTLKKALAKRGMTFRPYRFELDDSKLRKLYDAGDSTILEMARQLGSTEKVVTTHLEKLGLTNRVGHAGHHSRFWNGGRVIDKSGYVLILCKDHPHADKHGYVREHRLVMEKNLGRYLYPDEVVHHLAERGDNRIENLELFPCNEAHLRSELTGKVPKWSSDGEQNILEGLRRGRAKTLARSRSKSETDASQIP